MTNLLASLTSLGPLTKGLLIAVGVLSLTSVGEGLLLYHEIGKKAEIVQAVKDAKVEATHIATVVQERDSNNVQATQTNTTDRIASDVSSLRNEDPSPYLPAVAKPSANPTGEGSPPVVLPGRYITELDAEDCVIAVDKAEGWQTFYNNLLTVRQEEMNEDGKHTNPNPSSSASSSQVVPGSPYLSLSSPVWTRERVGDEGNGKE